MYLCVVARMDVTKQQDMNAFYRNLLDQSTDSVIKTEPTESEDTTQRYILFINVTTVSCMHILYWCLILTCLHVIVSVEVYNVIAFELLIKMSELSLLILSYLCFINCHLPEM